MTCSRKTLQAGIDVAAFPPPRGRVSRGNSQHVCGAAASAGLMDLGMDLLV